MNCVNNETKYLSKCLPPCSGVIITSFSKNKPIDDLESKIKETVSAYGLYTKRTTFPSELKGDNELTDVLSRKI